MRKKYVMWLLLLLLVMGVTVGIRSAAQLANRGAGAGSSAASTNMLDYVQRLNTALKANTAATNLTNQQMNSLMDDSIKTNLAAELWARSTVQSMRSSKGADIAAAVRVLEYLRRGHTNDAMRELEAKLEGDVASLGQFLDATGPAMHMEIRAEYLVPLQMAKEYWLKFPRAAANPDVDSGVKHALSLVDKKE